MIIAVFRYVLLPDADLDALESLHQRMHSIVSTIPGFVSVKDFAAEDGEGATIVEFDSSAALEAWRDHPEHRAAQKRGRQEFFAGYRVTVCELIRVATG